MMGKKKHRSRRAKKATHDCETSEEESTFENTGSSCPHSNKAVNLSNVKKALKDVKVANCQQCDGTSVCDSENVHDIWMCLYCGNQGCDRNSPGQHAYLHYQTPHSDAHSLAFCLANSVLWCYDCDTDVPLNGSKKLLECIEFIKKLAGSENLEEKTNVENSFATVGDCSQLKAETVIENTNSQTDLAMNFNKNPNSIAKPSKTTNPAISNKNENIPKIKGLINLGNTCFLNSVLQSLVQTNILFDILSSRAEKGISVTIDNTYFENDSNQSEKNLPSLEITLSETGPLSHTFCLFFKDYTSKTKTVNPSQLLGQICKRSPQFRGALQQDSHELLRHLLDGVKSEEIKRYQAGILRAFGLGEKVNPKSVDDETKAAVKAYGRCIPNTLIDDIFSGQLISTVLCEECGMSSQVFEPFLDLSLPVTEEKVNRPGFGKKSGHENDVKGYTESKVLEKPSKHQEKKSKKQAKRNAKVQRNKMKQDKKKFVNNVEDNSEIFQTDVTESPIKSLNDMDDLPQEDTETSDADVEDNAESGSTCSITIPNNSAPAIVQGKELINDIESLHYVNENNCYKLESSDMGLNEQLKDLHVKAEENILPSADINEMKNDEYESCVANGVNDNASTLQKVVTEGKAELLNGKKNWMSKSITTLALRYQPVSQECSIYSCLNQFTTPELLTGPNKFGCENCTRLKKEKESLAKDKSGKSEQKSSMVYTNASKQLLICSPPAILTLHLKRFQQVGYSLRKVNRHVEFPLILDLAPFCSSICLGLPTLKNNQHQVLYYLYAVVEHSGRLTGGHYTAYVRASPKDEKLYDFLNLKQVSPKDINILIEEMQTKLCSCDGAETCSNNINGLNLPIDNLSRWFHISDSCISEVSESTVLRCQAYLLFYRRIM